MAPVLLQGSPEQPQAVQPVRGQNAPGAEVAEPLAPTFDQALGVERELNADDLARVDEHEPGVRALDLPGNGDRLGPLLG